MMVTIRREGESILIGDSIEVRIIDVRRSKVKLGISAPRDLRITTREHVLVREQNLLAAVSSDRVVWNLAADSVAGLLQESSRESTVLTP
jgi:carbon storage regulator